MWQVVKRWWDFVAAFATLLGILYVPADLFGLAEQYPVLGRVAAMADRFTVLAAFSGILVLYILWIDARPWLRAKLAARTHRNAAPNQFVAFDPPDIVDAKQQISRFVANHLSPSKLAAHEAVKGSARVFQKAWSDSPAGKYGFRAILTVGMRLSPELDALGRPDWVRSCNLDTLQHTLLKAVLAYRVTFHNLHEVSTDLVEHNRLEDSHGFFTAVQEWFPKHQNVINEFLKLKENPLLKIIREAKMEIYFYDPKYDLNVIKTIAEPPKPLLPQGTAVERQQ
jgi:hypothetical protein